MTLGELQRREAAASPRRELTFGADALDALDDGSPIRVTRIVDDALPRDVRVERLEAARREARPLKIDADMLGANLARKRKAEELVNEDLGRGVSIHDIEGKSLEELARQPSEDEER